MGEGGGACFSRCFLASVHVCDSPPFSWKGLYFLFLFRPDPWSLIVSWVPCQEHNSIHVVAQGLGQVGRGGDPVCKGRVGIKLETPGENSWELLETFQGITPLKVENGTSCERTFPGDEQFS